VNGAPDTVPTQVMDHGESRASNFLLDHSAYLGNADTSARYQHGLVEGSLGTGDESLALAPHRSNGHGDGGICHEPILLHRDVQLYDITFAELPRTRNAVDCLVVETYAVRTWKIIDQSRRRSRTTLTHFALSNFIELCRCDPRTHVLFHNLNHAPNNSARSSHSFKFFWGTDRHGASIEK
jgi:hypothetical protein